MNLENQAKVEAIKAIVDTLSDLKAVSAIEKYMYTRRWHIAKNAERELAAQRNKQKGENKE